MKRLEKVAPFVAFVLLIAACVGPQPAARATPTAVPPRATAIAGATTAISPPLTPTLLPGLVALATPLAEPFHQSRDLRTDEADVIVAWDMTKGPQGWSPTHHMAPFTTEEDGINTRATGGDPYMFGPRISMQAETAPYLEVRMRSTKGKHAQVFWEVDGRPFNETDSFHFQVEDDGAWHTYLLPLKSSAAWAGHITRLRLDPSNTEGGAISIAYIRLLGPLPGYLQLDQLGASHGLVLEDEPFAITAVVRNAGDRSTEPITLALEHSAGLLLRGDTAAVPALEPNATYTVTWEAAAEPGPQLFAVQAGEDWLGRSELVCESPEPEQTLELSHGDLRLDLAQQPFGFGTGTLYWRDGDHWRQAGRLRSAGRLLYLDEDGNQRLALLYAQAYAQDEDRLTLIAEHTDLDGRLWTVRTSFVAAPDHPWFTVESVLHADASGRLLAWAGPDYLPGEGSFGSAKDSGLFPGLEFLLGEEQSSGTDFFDASVADRYVPHPNKVTMPLMSVTHEGLVTGLMWDPLQEWAQGHDRPAALYAVPNRWDHQPNHLMRLFAPGMTGGLKENRESLLEPMHLAVGTEQRLIYQLFATEAEDELTALRLWLGEHGLTALPLKPFSYERSIELSMRAYLETTWSPQDQGWHHALHDPWGPGADNAAALHLWWATLADNLPVADTAHYREIAMEGTGAAARHGGPMPWRYLPTLAMHVARSPSGLVLGKTLAEQSLVAQTTEGGFVFTPDPTGPRAFGRAGDTSTGHTAMHAYPLLLGARFYGDRSLEVVGMRALDYLRAQPYRPEGAQTWELQLHVPDLLGAAWCVESFVEAYRLTGDSGHLKEAQRWALSGMPFVYLWSAPDRDLMAYGTIPVFGATRFSWPWIGRPVQWNGLAYAIALMDLTEALEEASLPSDLDWPHVAEGIVIATMQMQATEGRFLGMYPDAWDVVIGDEAYEWWLIPSWHLQALLRVTGAAGVEPVTEIIDAAIDGTPHRVHVSAVGELLEVTFDHGELRVRLAYPPGEDTVLMVSNLLLPKRVVVNGIEAPRTSQWTSGEPAWQWERRVMPIHVPMQEATAEVVIVMND